jgi:hypothetical protein
VKALTLWPEWAWAIDRLDKRVENRDWPIPLGWYALHAGKNIGGRPGAPATIEGIESVARMARCAGWFSHGSAREAEFVRVSDALTVRWNLDDVPTSAIVGAIRIGWRVDDAVGNLIVEYRPLARPVPCKGAQGLWTVPEDVVAEMKRIGARVEA